MSSHRVLKYKLQTTGEHVLHVPESWDFLSVGAQAPFLVLWGMCRTDDLELSMRIVIRVVGTGWEFDHDEEIEVFVGTVQLTDGTVWHVFIRQVS